MKKVLGMLLVIAMACTLFACGGNGGQGDQGGSEAKKGGTYIIQQSGEPATLNPDVTSDDYNYSIVQNVYSRLYKLNNNYEAIPDLATSYEVSEDALTYTFHLREGVKWHDGEPFSAEDVVYTYKTIIEKAYANASVFMFVADITAPDANTVVFTMSQPDGSFISNLSWYGTFILPKHLYEGTDWAENPCNQAPVGTGPFKFDVWNKGTDIQIVRNDDYFGDVALLDRVIFTVIPDANTAYQAWLNDEVDEVETSGIIPNADVESLKAKGDSYTWINQLWPSLYYLTFNTEKGPFTNVLVREAVAMGIDREAVSQKATLGFFPAENYYISGLYVDALNEDAKAPACDKEGAMKKLEEAGYTKGADGFYFTTTLRTMDGFDDYAVVVADELKQIGINVQLDILDYNIWYEKCLENYDFEMSMLGGFQGPDVLGAGRRWTTGGVVNVGRYSNPTVDDLYAKALAATSQDEINGYMKEIQTHLAKDIPNYNLVAYNLCYPIKGYVHGHPMQADADGGSIGKTGFSEMTYTWLSK